METPLSSPPSRGAAPKGGWRVKERKPHQRIALDRMDAAPVMPLSRGDVQPSEPEKTPTPKSANQRWRKSFGVLTGASIAAGALMIMTGTPSAWLHQSGASHPAVAETYASTSSTEESVGTPQVPRAYRLHLGAYQSELSARLAWAGFEADSNMLLEGLDPSFDRRESDDGTLYHVLAGAYSRRDLADDHCSWLARRNLDCSIVGG